MAFLNLERARERVREGDGLSDALKAVARNTVFTTHTPVPAGNETFDRNLVRRYLEFWIREVGCDPERGAGPGRRQRELQHDRPRHPPLLGHERREPAARAGVLGHVAPPLPGGRPEAPVGAITNGVHTESWVGPEMRAFYAQHLDPHWEQHLLEAEFWTRIREVPDAGLWAAHRSQKERLIRFVRERVRQQSARHGLSPDELRMVEGLLDPHALTIGFARRFATYKRAFLILSDLDRLRALVADPARPVQLIFAGKAHPADREGQEVIRRLVVLTKGEFQGKLVFLEDYDIEIGRAMLQGCDVWLNTPRRPQEASGTSGQKVPDQRRGQRQHPRRLVGGGLPGRQRLGHRRRQGGPGRGRAGPERRGVALPDPLRGEWSPASSPATSRACPATGSRP